MHLRFEQLLAQHCAPTLAHLKPASLVTLRRAEFPDLSVLSPYVAALGRAGVRMKVLCQCERRYLLLLYRAPALLRCLQHPICREILQKEGYPMERTLAMQLTHLCRRLAQSAEFPHEIGLFLGYPPADVLGFARYGGRNCKLCGHWKVYSDVAYAKSCFAAYDRCKDRYLAHVARGQSLLSLLDAAS